MKTSTTIIKNKPERLKRSKNRRKKIPTRKKLRYIDGFPSQQQSHVSDSDDIPLSRLISRKRSVSDSSDLDDDYVDKTYKPNSKDLNSTDSEFMSDISESTRRSRKKKLKTKRMLDKTMSNKAEKKQNSNKQKRASKKMDESLDKERKRAAKDRKKEEAQIVKSTQIASLKNQIILKAKIKASENVLDKNLQDHCLRRIKVPAQGDCFFEAAKYAIPTCTTASELRRRLCNHIEQNSEEYAGFLLNLHKPADDETFVMEYLQQIENLKCDGYWTNRVADFLPLALANVEKKKVIIYTCREDQPVITVQPNITEASTEDVIMLAYISIPNTLEHYDACSALDSEVNDINLPNDTPEVEACAESQSIDQILYASPVQQTATPKQEYFPEEIMPPM